MNLTVETINAFTKKLSFDLPADEVTAEFDRVFKDVKKSAKSPGFRKGKVPNHIVEQQYATAINEEVLKNLVNKTCYEGLKEHRIIPISPPSIESDEVKKGENFTYSVTVETYPEVDPTGYQGLSLEKEKHVHNEATVEERLAKLQESMAELKPLETARPVQTGDFTVINFAGYLNNELFPGGSAEGYQLEIGSGSFIPGFEDQLIGMNCGDTKRFPITFPENYGNSELAGKEVEFEVTILELKVKELPALDDELAKSSGGVETMEQLRNQITEAVIQEERARIDGELKDALMEALVKLNPFDIPATLADRQLQFMLETTKQRLAAQQMSFEMMGLSEDDYKARYRDSAEFQVKEMLILHAIAKKEGLSLAQEDVEKKYAEISAQIGRDVAEIKGYYEKNRDAAEHLGSQIVEDKVMDFLLASATVTEVHRDQAAN